jgi:hypothetical protein
MLEAYNIAALKAAYKEYTKRSFVEWGTDFVDVALGVYEELRVDRLGLLARRGRGREAEKRELEASDRAISYRSSEQSKDQGPASQEER